MCGYGNNPGYRLTVTGHNDAAAVSDGSEQFRESPVRVGSTNRIFNFRHVVILTTFRAMAKRKDARATP